MDISLRFIFGSKRVRTRIRELEASNQWLLDQNNRLLDKMDGMIDKLEKGVGKDWGARGEHTAIH